jgi:hypothetical protein
MQLPTQRLDQAEELLLLLLPLRHKPCLPLFSLGHQRRTHLQSRFR